VTLSRRRFLGTSAALVGLTSKTGRPVAGGFVDGSAPIGHRLRDHCAFPTPERAVRIPLVIVGGGIAGLSAAWRLDKRGFRDFVIVEMEQRAGGNARWGENEVTAYPWGAHYVPVPGRRAVLVRELFEELGILRDGQWEERYLCFDPQERLFLHGTWQDGLEPTIGLGTRDREELRRFAARMAEFRATGRFTIPMALGAGDAASPLDRVSMAEWLQHEGFTSPVVRWYVDYACRDDYGALLSDASAWAGVHYFASREPEERGPLTWPEGNGWIVRQLLARVGKYLETNAFVHRIEPTGTRWRVLAARTTYVADAVIFAAPTFLAPYVIPGVPDPHFVYSPWLTANLTLDRWPRERGMPVAWDNVIYNSPALGYVVATHQSLRTTSDRTVWTFYWALADGAPAANRALLLQRDWGFWKEAILADLERAHPDIRTCVSRIDVMRLGHAMVRPAVGFLAVRERFRRAHLPERVFFANSDLSGLSLFEEAQYRGVTAADRALATLTRP